MRILPGKVNPALLKTFLAYLAVSLALFILPARLTGPVRDVALYPFGLLQRLTFSAVRTMASFGRLPELWRADREAAELRDRVRQLETELTEETARRKAAEARLAALSRVPPALQRRAVAANVVAFDPTPMRRVALLNRGARAGVAPRGVVLWNGAIVGRVESVGPFTARVALLGDPQCRIAVRCLRSRVRGVLEGAGGARCVVKYVDLAADVRAGDRFVTSDLDAALPPGRWVADCVEVTTVPGEIFRHVRTKPLFELSDLDDVIVLIPPAVPPKGERKTPAARR